MALEFPHVDVVGIDFVPPVLLSAEAIPPNCRFEVDDANLSMTHYKDCFNMVHVRSADQGINDFNGCLYELAQTLRPGGILVLSTGIPQMYMEDYTPFPVTEPGEENFTWIQKLLGHTYQALLNRGNPSVEACLHWVKWLEENPNYENVLQSDTFVCLGAWKPGLDETAKWVADGMKIDLMHILPAWKPLLLSDGVPSEQIDFMIEEATKELRDETIHAQCSWRYTTATRTKAPYQERMETPLDVEPGPRPKLMISAKSKSAAGNRD
ncbi:hypothetical protein FRB94_002795 [Tulasnella sp. JGI-2019a]|nr:hypothetical protein FRB94_002795 [Tulasnella sp. JGI-2019a]